MDQVTPGQLTEVRQPNLTCPSPRGEAQIRPLRPALAAATLALAVAAAGCETEAGGATDLVDDQ
ncbi:hypothetical protein Acsp02_66070 [Actinoplanes sp. NBRC 103695]|nr:hypothetical protein Acsp02_66070 [Actinoplanes sp. NBRC 103695]